MHRHDRQAEWTHRGHRAIPKLAVPAAREIDPAIMDGLRPLVVLLIARPLVAAVVLASIVAQGWWLLLPLATWFLYGSALAAIHHLLHGGLGLSPRWRHRWLSVLACLVVESGHALLATHTNHHRDGSDRPDPEGYIEYLGWRELPMGAAKYRYRLMWWGLHHGTHRSRIRAELAVHAAAHIGSLLLLPVSPVLWVYLTCVHVASVGFAVLQSKGPQANWGREMPSPLLLVRTRLLAMLFFHHHQHLEHHSYPKVPLTRLHRLRPALEEALVGEDVTELRLAA